MQKDMTVKDKIASYDGHKVRGLEVQVLVGNKPQLFVGFGGATPEMFRISKSVARALIAFGVNHGS